MPDEEICWSSAEAALREVSIRDDMIDRYITRLHQLVENNGLPFQRAFARVYHRARFGLAPRLRRVSSLSVPQLEGCGFDEA